MHCNREIVASGSLNPMAIRVVHFIISLSCRREKFYHEKRKMGQKTSLCRNDSEENDDRNCWFILYFHFVKKARFTLDTISSV